MQGGTIELLDSPLGGLRVQLRFAHHRAPPTAMDKGK
jgi:hypothetical protein